MLELTESARKELEAFFADKEKETIRIYASSSCCGPRLGMALDESHDTDEVLEKDGFTFCMDKDLLAQVKSVKVDLTYMGFAIEPEVPLPAGEGGGCSSCGSGCGSSCGG